MKNMRMGKTQADRVKTLKIYLTPWNGNLFTTTTFLFS
jgi:hypothetical protein